MRLGILGGTFDPVHSGHLKLAEHAKKQFHLDKILFIPALVPPHKADRRDLTPAPYRYRMVELAIRNHPEFEISDVEFNRPEVSYTIDTLRALKERDPSADFFLILGADSLAEIHKWRHADEILSMAHLLAAARPGSEKNSRGLNMGWIEMPECPYSSSEIRTKIAKGEKLEEGMLPAGVGEYIKKMNLYGGGNPACSC